MSTPVDNWTALDLAQWKAWTFGPVKFMVEGLIPLDGLVWLGGRPKRGKSLFALYLACCIAYGRPEVAGHFQILKRPRILYVCREDSGGRVMARLADITKRWTEEPLENLCRIVVRPKFDIGQPVHIEWLMAECAEYGIGFVILDTWTALSPNADPLGAADQTKLAQALAQFTQWFEGCCLVIDHSRKNKEEGQPLTSADIMGPSQKWQAAETIIMLAETKAKGRLEGYLESKDVNDGRFFLDVSRMGSEVEKFTYGGTVEAATEAREAKGQGNRNAIHKILVDAKKPMGLSEVTALSPVGRSATHNHLKALVKAERATCDGSFYEGIESEF
jgi:hypothetical protein